MTTPIQNRLDFGSASITRLARTDISRETDSWLAFHEFVLRSEEFYPNIRAWLHGKVANQIGSRKRAAYVLSIDDRAVATAVIKVGEASKLCHLSISDNYQDQHLGEILFAFFALEAFAYASEVHFTLPEALWEGRKRFFSSFGFTKSELAGTQYRLFDRELKCSATFGALWQAVLQKIPKLNGLATGASVEPSILISLKPRWADAILSGQKKVEIRKTFSDKWTNHKCSLYSSKPCSSIVGEATIKHVDIGPPPSVWDRYSHQIGCSKAEFDAYVGGAQKIFAIVLDEATSYSHHLPLERLVSLSDRSIHAPQAYCSLDPTTTLGRSVSVAHAVGTLLPKIMT